MFERFSEPARRVVFWAHHEACRAGAETIEPEHLLLGLLTEDQGGRPATTPFFSARQASNLRRMLVESTAGLPAKPDHMDMPLAERSKRTLEAARERAGESIVGPPHVLWALISDGEGAVSDLLKANGVTIGQIEDAIG